MTSAAIIRLLSDLKQISEEPPEGASAAPLSDDNLLLWSASIFGPEDTPWEGGIFTLRLQFSDQYPDKAPKVRFLTEVYHPNVYQEGSLCLDIIQDKWSPIYSVSTILTSIQSLLCDPNPNSPANPEAANLYNNDRKAYNKRCIQSKYFETREEMNDYYTLPKDETHQHQPLDSPRSSKGMIPPLNPYSYREINNDEIKLEDNPIGKGAFGIVFKGSWRGASVAVKQLLLSFPPGIGGPNVRSSEEELIREEIRREATMIQRVANHPNIVRFLGASTQKPPYCLVSEFYSKGSVFSLLQSNQLEWKTIVGFAKDAAAGLLHLHCEELIHRDIAARNLLVDDHWTARIADFGLSRIKVKAVSQTKSNVGPVRSMAPESLQSKVYSIKSDSYSFGIMMWELLTGKEPYDDLDPIQIALGVLQGNRPEVPTTSPAVWTDLMTRCWKVDPAERPDFQEIYAILHKYHATLRSPPSTPKSTRSPSYTPPSVSITDTSSASGSSGASDGAFPKFDIDLDCPICSDIFNEVVETPCCHRCYCRKCIASWITNKQTCPDCRQKIEVEKLLPNFPFQRLVDNLPAVCPFDGCTDKLTRGCLVDHERKCPYALVECDLHESLVATDPDIASMSADRRIPCGEFPRKDLAIHTTSSCPYRIVSCPSCGQNVRLLLIDDHVSVCPRVIVACRLNCGAEIARQDVDRHLRDECSLQEVPCTYTKLNCDHRALRKDIPAHTNDTGYHLSLAMREIDRKDEMLTSERATIDHLSHRVGSLQDQIVRLIGTVDHLAILKPALPHQPMNSLPVILPTRLAVPDEVEAAGLVTIDPDGVTVTYTPKKDASALFSSRNYLPKAAMVCACRPIPTHNEIYFFEMSIKHPGKDGAIGIGIAKATSDQLIMPGWKPMTYGYHGDDGRKFGGRNTQFGQEFGPTYTKDDVIGCGFDSQSSCIFFTLNRMYLGVAFDSVRGENYYPVVGLHTIGAKVRVNFGAEPFVFNIREFDRSRLVPLATENQV